MILHYYLFTEDVGEPFLNTPRWNFIPFIVLVARYADHVPRGIIFPRLTLGEFGKSLFLLDSVQTELRAAIGGTNLRGLKSNGTKTYAKRFQP